MAAPYDNGALYATGARPAETAAKRTESTTWEWNNFVLIIVDILSGALILDMAYKFNFY